MLAVTGGSDAQLRLVDILAFKPAIVKKWCYRSLFLYGVLLALFALAAGVASNERPHSDRSPAVDGVAKAYSGAGNLVPAW